MTSRAIMFLGSRDPYKPSFATGKGPPPNNIHVKHISEKKKKNVCFQYPSGTLELPGGCRVNSPTFYLRAVIGSANCSTGGFLNDFMLLGRW